MTLGILVGARSGVRERTSGAKREGCKEGFERRDRAIRGLMVARVGLSSTVARQTLEGKHVLGSTRFRTFLPTTSLLFFFSPPVPSAHSRHPRSLTLPLDLLRSTIPRYVPAIPVLSFFFTAFFSHFSLRLQSTRVSLHSYAQPVTADKPIGPIHRFFIAVSKRATLEQRRTRISGNSRSSFFLPFVKSELARFKS